MKRLYNISEHREEIKAALTDGRLWLILRAFLFPKLARRFLLRIGIVILISWIFFKFICLPLVIDGESMLPTYPSRGFLFCWTPAYWFSSPEIGDVVIMKYGKGVMLLKRIVALEGDRIAFHQGKLYRNGQAVEEAYLNGKCDWELPERTVGKDCFYLVGDNRTMPMNCHVFGEMHKRYLAGRPSW